MNCHIERPPANWPSIPASRPGLEYIRKSKYSKDKSTPITTKSGVLYALCLGAPKNAISIKALAKNNSYGVKGIPWKVSGEGPIKAVGPRGEASVYVELFVSSAKV